MKGGNEWNSEIINKMVNHDDVHDILLVPFISQSFMTKGFGTLKGMEFTQKV